MAKKTYHRSKKSITPQQAAIAAIVVLVLLFASMLRAGCQKQPDNRKATGLTEKTDSNLNSSEALEDVILPRGVPNRQLQYEGFKIGFNPEAHQPNFASWTLTPDKTDGPYSRKDAKFAQDPDVDGCATLNDYRRSGFDRGHMVPAADMKWSAQAMADCHYLTNMCPQDNRLNGGAWASLENLERRWANKFGRLIIVAGPVLSDRLSRTIGESKVLVPDRFFKVIIAPDFEPAMGIGFIMPNGELEGGVQAATMSIDQVEAITGMDFFHNLPDNMENELEAQNLFNQWTIR